MSGLDWQEGGLAGSHGCVPVQACPWLLQGRACTAVRLLSADKPTGPAEVLQSLRPPPLECRALQHHLLVLSCQLEPPLVGPALHLPRRSHECREALDSAGMYG